MKSNSGSDYAPVILAMATLVVFGALGLARFGYGAVLPAMQKDLHLGNAEAGLLATANLGGYLVFCVLGGALASHIGPRAVITAGLCLAGAAMALTGCAHSAATAMFWRAVTGIGSGASNVPVMGLLAAWFARERRGAAAGVAVAGSSLALMVVGPLVPRLLARFGDSGWRVCWFVFGGLTIALAAAAWAVLRNRPAARGEDAGGPQWGLVYRSGAVWRLGAVYVAFGFSYIIYMTFFFKHVLNAGCSVAAAGRLFTLLGFCSLFCGLIWGGLSDRVGRKAALAAVYLVQAAAFALFALSRTPSGFALSAALFGLTAWSIPAIMAAACGDLLGARLAPAALGFITVFFGAGQALGPYAAGALADACGGFSAAFLLAAGIALAGAAGCVLLEPSARRCNA